jgi:hypothetical protein
MRAPPGAVSVTAQQLLGNAMTISLLDEDSLKRILIGGVLGVGATVFAGFVGLGWTLDSTAKEQAKRSASAAVVEALAPICADKFQHAADAAKNKDALMKVSAADQGAFITKGGWATMPGSNNYNSTAVADACAKMLSALK